MRFWQAALTAEMTAALIWSLDHQLTFAATQVATFISLMLSGLIWAAVEGLERRLGYLP